MASTLHTYPGTVLPFRNTASKNTEVRPVFSAEVQLFKNNERFDVICQSLAYYHAKSKHILLGPDSVQLSPDM